jgi:hypothetical protein
VLDDDLKRIMSPRQQRTPAASKTTRKWRFTSRIRPNVFSWRSSAAAVARIRDAVTEITNVGRKDPVSGHYHGTTACLSALLHARRYEEIRAVLAYTDFWHYTCYGVKALAAEGKPDEAITLAEASRGPWTSDVSVDRLCERILLNAGRTEEAYRLYGLVTHRGGTHLATFRGLPRHIRACRAGRSSRI